LELAFELVVLLFEDFVVRAELTVFQFKMFDSIHGTRLLWLSPDSERRVGRIADETARIGSCSGAQSPGQREVPWWRVSWWCRKANCLALCRCGLQIVINGFVDVVTAGSIDAAEAWLKVAAAEMDVDHQRTAASS
jgi:hypothetical protein